MNVGSIEQLVRERADQRAEEVFGLLLSFMQRQIEAAPKNYPGKTELVLKGYEVRDLTSLDLTVRKDLKIELRYRTDDPHDWERFEEVIVFDNVMVYNGDEYTDMTFDGRNYIRIWK